MECMDPLIGLPHSHVHTQEKMHTHVLSVHRKSGTRVLITALVIIAPNRSCQTSPATEWKHGGGGQRHLPAPQL